MDVKFYKGSDVEPNIFGLRVFGKLEQTLLRLFQEGWARAFFFFFAKFRTHSKSKGVRTQAWLEPSGSGGELFCVIFL